MKQVMLAFPILTLCKHQDAETPARNSTHLSTKTISTTSSLTSGADNASPSGARVNKDKAVCCTALIRVPEVITPNLLALSGTNGLFIDPRDQSGKAPDERYGVIWLPGATLQIAHHKHRTTEGSISVIRLNDRYGLRFNTAQLPQAHHTLKPDEPYLQVKVVDIYKLFPLPHGTQRQGPSSHSHPGDGAQDHFNPARATATASDGKLALNRHLQATSCKEPMGTSWSPNSGQSDPHQSAPTWLSSTAPRNFFTATTRRQPPLLPHNGPTTPGKPGRPMVPMVQPTSPRRQIRTRTTSRRQNPAGRGTHQSRPTGHVPKAA